jgi:glucan biosynthesis protein C
MQTTTDHGASRLYFLDWVRIIAFFLLILYHVGMYYVTWDWHVKSPHASDAIEPLMMLTSPWRLSLLFLISGVASGFMLTKLSAGKFMRTRSWRLLVPLIFGMVFIVPPQPYFEVIEKLAYTGSFGDFMELYLRAYHGFCKDGKCLDLPTWNHLWFVAYLWNYTLVLGVMALALGSRMQALSERVARLLTGWKIIVLPLAVLAIARLALLDRFPQTHGLFDDWYNHAHYLFLFVLGALLCRQAAFWKGVGEQRWAAFGIAIFCWAALMVYFSLPEAVHAGLKDSPVRMIMRTVYAACEWTAIVAACGFAQRLLNFDSAKRRYLTEAVFPVYILHQTLIVSMAHLMKPAGMPPVLEGAVLVILTFCISFGVFEAVRRVPVLRPLFGLGKLEKTAASRQPLEQGAALAA